MHHRKLFQTILFLCLSAVVLTGTVFALPDETATYRWALTVTAGGTDYVLPAQETVYAGISTHTVDLTPLANLSDAHRAEAARGLLMQLGYAEGAASLREETLQNMVGGSELNITRQYETRKGRSYMAIAHTRVSKTEHFVLGFAHGLDPENAWRLHVMSDNSFSVSTKTIQIFLQYDTGALSGPMTHEFPFLRAAGLKEDELTRHWLRMADSSLSGRFGVVLHLAFLQEVHNVFFEASYFCAASTVKDPANIPPKVFGGIQASTIDDSWFDRYVGYGVPTGDHLVTTDGKITIDFPHGFGIKIYDKYPECRLHD